LYFGLTEKLEFFSKKPISKKRPKKNLMKVDDNFKKIYIYLFFQKSGRFCFKYPYGFLSKIHMVFVYIPT